MVSALQVSREKVGNAFNTLAGRINEEETKLVTSCDAETQSPCWWDIGGTRRLTPRQASTTGNVGATMGIPTPSWTVVVKKGNKQKPPAPAAKTDKVEKPTIT